MNRSLTAEISADKVSLVKVAENGTTSKEKVSGLEWGPPTVGRPYVVYLGQRRYLKTSPIRDLKEIHNALMFKTVNSAYRIEYVKKDRRQNPGRLTGTMVNGRRHLDTQTSDQAPEILAQKDSLSKIRRGSGMSEGKGRDRQGMYFPLAGPSPFLYLYGGAVKRTSPVLKLWEIERTDCQECPPHVFYAISGSGVHLKGSGWVGSFVTRQRVGERALWRLRLGQDALWRHREGREI